MVRGIKKDWLYDMNKAFRYVQLILLGVGTFFLISKYFVGGELSEFLFKVLG
ncbi:hypothetical protein [uncultured Clostridium sp.]|uniref:hypothetical protein n=1 Tax=uncultured Clostridium sp. TaxID=59620 RepID=UPI0026355393|nr:hypothetical protein [uncultured Clostridium sp.]